MTDADYTDDLVLFASAPAQAESLLHYFELTVGGTGLCMNSNKTEYIHFKQKEVISTLSGEPLTLTDQFTYIGSNILFTESDQHSTAESLDRY